MKKVVITAVFFLTLSAAGAAGAETPPADNEYKNLDELRVKMVRAKREMDKFMKELLSAYPDQYASGGNLFGQDVRVDISQTERDIIVRADLPGMDKDKIEVVLESGRMLKISGSREISRSESSPGMVRQERSSGHFERVLELPVECRPDGIKATYKNGVLEMVIPKKKASKEESVKIDVQ